MKMAMLGTFLVGCNYGAVFGDCEVACHAPDQCPGGFGCGSESLCRAAGATQSCMAVLGDAHQSNDGSAGNTTVTLRQTIDDVIAPNLTESCTNGDNTTGDMHWYRVFSLAQDGIPGTFHVDNVTFGVEQSVGQPQVAIALGTYGGTFGASTLDQTKIAPVVTSNVVVPATTTGELVMQAFNQDIPGGAILVVELDVADQTGTGRRVNIGLTTNAEARAGYERSATCGPAVPSTTPSNKHLIITVTGRH